MPEIFKRPYDYLLRYDPLSQNVYRADGIIPITPNFLSGLTIQTNFQFSDGSEQNGYVLMSDSFGNASWQPVSGATPVSGVTSIITSTGLSGDSTTGNVTLINTAPDQTVTISGGTGIITGGTYPNFTITNSSPDQTVTISGGTGITTGGTYPNFSLVNSAPDQTVTITEGTNISVTGVYPNFTISQTGSTGGGSFTGGTVTGSTNFTNGLSANTFSATTYLGLPSDIYITGGSFNNNTDTLTLTRSSGSSITITGFTDYYTTGATLIANTIYFDRNDLLSAYTVNLSSFAPSTDVFVTGGTYSSGTAVFTNNTGGTFNVTGFYTGETITISGGTGIATGGTYPNFTITNTSPDQTVVLNSGTNISVTGTYPNFTISQTGSTGGSFTGGTVTGDTNFTGVLSANTFSATTISGGTLYGDGSNLTNITIPTGTTTGSFGININNGVSEVTTGFKGYVKMPYSGTIIGWTIMGSVSGSTSIDIWKDTEINFPPTSADTITAGNYPNLTNQYINSDNILTGWITNFNANDIFSFNVLSSSGVTNLNLTINVIKN